MNLRLPALIPWMVVAGMAHGQIRTADVLYTFKEAESQPAYRLGDECFVSLETAAKWGWKVDKVGDAVNLIAEGHSIHMDVRFVAGKTTIALRKVIQQLGGQTSWTSGADTLNVYSVLRNLSVRGMKVHAEGAMNFKGTPSYLSPGRTVIDFDGARLGSTTLEDLPANVKAVQYRPNVVRLTIPTSFVPKSPEEPLAETSYFDYQILKDQDLAETPPPPFEHQSPPQTINQKPPGNSPLTSTQNPELISVTIDRDEAGSATLGVHVPDPLPGPVLVDKSDSLSLQLILPVVAQLPTSNFYLSSKSVESVVARASGTGTILTIHLTKPMGSEIVNDRNGVTVNLSARTTYGDGHLAGKTIVIDPGHGGHDKGAHMANVNEKDLTLPIGKKIAALMQAGGANVILTRSDDTFIPLLERSAMSNRAHADLFISCHINSTGGAANQSGTITFHHADNKVCQYLAQCIQNEIAKVNGLPNLGVWSDHKIYSSGFSVLRNTTAPCVLIEMGFINQTRDRERMVTEDFQDSVAAAVVKGVRVFLGEIKPNE